MVSLRFVCRSRHDLPERCFLSRAASSVLVRHAPPSIFNVFDRDGNQVCCLQGPLSQSVNTAKPEIVSSEMRRPESLGFLSLKESLFVAYPLFSESASAPCEKPPIAQEHGTRLPGPGLWVPSAGAVCCSRSVTGRACGGRRRDCWTPLRLEVCRAACPSSGRGQAIGAFNEGVLCRLAGCDKVPVHARVVPPLQSYPTG